MLLHLPDGCKPEQVRDALSAKIQTIPDVLRASLTWAKDQRCATGNSVTRTHHRNGGTNENANGLLRQYFPRGTDLSIHSAIDLDWVATELNDRPRTRLGFKKPIEKTELLLLR